MPTDQTPPPADEIRISIPFAWDWCWMAAALTGGGGMSRMAIEGDLWLIPTLIATPLFSILAGLAGGIRRKYLWPRALIAGSSPRPGRR